MPFACFLLYHESGDQRSSSACRKPCKVGIKYLEDGSKVRVARGNGTSGSIIPRPEILKMRTTPRPTVGKILAFSSAYLCTCFFSIHFELVPAYSRIY